MLSACIVTCLLAFLSYLISSSNSGPQILHEITTSMQPTNAAAGLLDRVQRVNTSTLWGKCPDFCQVVTGQVPCRTQVSLTVDHLKKSDHASAILVIAKVLKLLEESEHEYL